MSIARTLRGIFPPLVTTFNPSTDAIVFSSVTHNLHKWKESGMAGYVVLGSNGETPLMTIDEKVSLVKHVADYCRRHHEHATVIAGAGVDSTSHTIDLCQRFAEVGAHYALVITPSFYKNAMTHEALLHHYTKVADASPLPVLLYSVPGNTNIDMAAETAIALSKHNNIVGMKDSGGDITKIARIVAETRANDFQVMAGSAGFLLPAFQAGCVGGVCALANVLPSQLAHLHSAFESAGWSSELQDRQTELIQANAIVTRGLGVAALKHIMNTSGFEAGQPRSPLLPLTTAQQTQVENIFKRFN